MSKIWKLISPHFSFYVPIYEKLPCDIIIFNNNFRVCHMTYELLIIKLVVNFDSHNSSLSTYLSDEKHRNHKI